MDTSFIQLPNKIDVDPLKYYKSTRDVCYWSNNETYSNEIVYCFIEKAKEYNLTEDQALAILMFNNFDITKSQYDMQIYRPFKGLGKVDVKQLVKIISDNIEKTIKAREHRDFDDVLLMFPGYTVGDVLGAYSKHRFLIKRETYKIKKCMRKSILRPYLKNGGLKDIEPVSWNDSCTDTQFQLIYRKHYDVIQNSYNLQEFLCRDLCDIKQYNGGTNKTFDGSHDAEADVILTLLKKMNRKRNKQGSMFETSQLSNILTFAMLKRKSKEATSESLIGTKVEQSKSLCNRSMRSDSSAVAENKHDSEMSLNDKLYEYIKSDNTFILVEDSLIDDEEILNSLKELSKRHEIILEDFKNYLPDPEVFQQLSHSWSNMDFAILLLGLSEFGTNFDKVSDSIFTKSSAMVASFYTNHGFEFNLSEILKQSELEANEDVLNNEQVTGPLEIKNEVCLADNEPVAKTKNPRKSSNSKKNKKSKSKKTSKPKSDSKEIKVQVKEEPVTMNLRSRLETRNIMKSLIDEERKLKNMKFNSKKTMKRRAELKNESKVQQIKRNKKSSDVV